MDSKDVITWERKREVEQQTRESRQTRGLASASAHRKLYKNESLCVTGPTLRPRVNFCTSCKWVIWFYTTSECVRLMLLGGVSHGFLQLRTVGSTEAATIVNFRSQDSQFKSCHLGVYLHQQLLGGTGEGNKQFPAKRNTNNGCSAVCYRSQQR